MCVQTVGLIQAEIERQGITTVSLSLLQEVTTVIRPPRALFVPYRLGFPLGEPHNPALQLSIINSALALLPRNDLPILAEYKPGREWPVAGGQWPVKE